jgi:hypothetical protein
MKVEICPGSTQLNAGRAIADDTHLQCWKTLHQRGHRCQSHVESFIKNESACAY